MVRFVPEYDIYDLIANLSFMSLPLFGPQSFQNSTAAYFQRSLGSLQAKRQEKNRMNLDSKIPKLPSANADRTLTSIFRADLMLVARVHL